jgi:Xaa-Pro dipeptidase
MDYKGRMTQLLATMESQGLDTLVGFSSAAHHVDFGDAVALLTGVKPMAPSFAVLHKDGRCQLHLSPSWDQTRAEAFSVIDDIAMTDDIAASFDRVFKTNQTNPDRIGVADLGKMPHRLAKGFVEALGGTPKSADKILFEAASQKTDIELENARGATQIAERTYKYMLEIAEPGMKECHLAAELKNYSRTIGADDNFMMFHAEGHPMAVQPSSERKLEKGDLILAEITPNYRGQFAQICRTACLGEPTQEQVDKYDLLVRAMLNGIGKAKPGVAMKEICIGVDEVLIDNGYGEYCAPPYMNRRGHGLGVSSIEPGNVALNNETILEDGMFFVVHPNQYIPEVGYFLCGEPIIIRDPEADIITVEGAVLGTIDI